MTTITGPDTVGRIDALRRVPAAIRGLSLEPLWDRIPTAQLDLSEIAWMIVGGESGRRDFVRPFHLEWAVELRETCRSQGAAYFLKQLGRTPYQDGRPLTLKDSHGGDWAEWDESLRCRDFPARFHQYRENSASTRPQ